MSDRPGREPTYLGIGLQLLAVLWAIPVAAAALVLLAVADTWPGRIFAVTAGLVAILPFVAAKAWAGRSRRWIQGANAMTSALAVLLTILIAEAKVVKPGSRAERVTSQFTKPVGGWLRLSPANFVPEGDQLLFCFTLMTAIDPFLTSAQAAELRRLTAQLYREQAQDPDFAKLGSTMPEAYADLFGFPADSGHSYVYVPAGVDRNQPRPVLVFFHGSGGNFKAYLWVLAGLADELGFVLVAPSSGMGDWREGQSGAALESALVAAGRAAVIDLRQVHVMGLSNGGRALSQLGALRGAGLKSFVFLSPVFDDGAVNSALFAAQCAGRPVLVVTGARDDRVPPGYVEKNAGGMTRGGARVELNTFPDANHFLVFSHRRQLVQALTSWLAQVK